MQVGDVLLSIDEHPIASDASVDLEGERVAMSEIVERKFKGDSVKLHILRDKKEMDVTVQLDAAWPYMMQSSQYDVQPRYVLFGGLLFQPLSRDFLVANGGDDLRVRYFYDYYVADEIYRQHSDVIILSEVLPDPINTYVSEFKNSIVDEINGTQIKTLDDVANELKRPTDQYVIKLLGVGRPIVLERTAVEAARERMLDRNKVEAARERIKTRYSVVKEENLRE